jgi:putative sterol carrier protein
MGESDAIQAINKMLNNFRHEKAKKRFRKWNKVMAWEFTDLGKTFHSTITAGEPSSPLEGVPEKADIRIITDSNTWAGILSGEISGMKAYTGKKLDVKGKMTDLLKLQKVMKDLE